MTCQNKLCLGQGVDDMANEDKKDFNAMLHDSKDMPKFQTVTDHKSIEKYGGNRMYFAPPIDYDKAINHPSSTSKKGDPPLPHKRVTTMSPMTIRVKQIHTEGMRENKRFFINLLLSAYLSKLQYNYG